MALGYQERLYATLYSLLLIRLNAHLLTRVPPKQQLYEELRVE